MKCVWMFTLVAIASSTFARLEAQTCGPRVRKDWDMLTSDEKSTYRNALRAAMDSGAYIKFVEMHTEMRSEMEAHRQCMFIYWHRLLLLGFENMLRGQGPAYACVTLPYFNWVVASARTTAGACRAFGDCAAIMTELGGFTTGSQRTLDINGVPNSGRCVPNSPLDRFCESSSRSGSTCARCVPRTDWSVARVPSTTGYASVRNQVLNGRNIGEMSDAVERGCHNNVHATLGGTMSTYASPADPMFWSHHATVDLLHVIFHKCRVGSARLTFQEKVSHPIAWTSCARRDGGTFRPTDTIVMQTGERGVNPIPGSNDPLLRPFFAGVPNQFAGLMDIRDLGAHSYEYAVTGQLAVLYDRCDASPASRRLQAKMRTTNATSSSTLCSVASEDTDKKASSNNFPETEYTGQDDGHHDIVLVDRSGHPLDPKTPPEIYCTDKSEKRVLSWYDETLRAMGGDSPTNMDDLERQACMFENECLGGIQDYSPAFQAMWNVTEPRCKTIVKAIRNGSQAIAYAAWRQGMKTHFGCPKPTSVAVQTGLWGIVQANGSTVQANGSIVEANGSLASTKEIQEESPPHVVASVATELPARTGYTAVAAALPIGIHDAPHEAVSTAASVYDQFVQTFYERLGWLARAQPHLSGYAASLPPGSEALTFSGPCPHEDDCTPDRAGGVLPVGDAEAPSAMAAVPMEMDQGTTWQAGSPLFPSPLVHYLGGKRRRLNVEDDGDERERAEHSLLVDVKAGTVRSRPPSFPCLRTTRALHVHAVRIHGVKLRHAPTPQGLKTPPYHFPRPILGGLRVWHTVRFEAKHTLACGRLTDTLTAAAPASGDLSPTADAICANATVADLMLVLPHQEPTVLRCATPTCEHHCRQVYDFTMELPATTIASCVALRQGSCHTLGGGTTASERGGVKDRRPSSPPELTEFIDVWTRSDLSLVGKQFSSTDSKLDLYLVVGCSDPAATTRRFLPVRWELDASNKMRWIRI
ncbi:hypothetical protein PsorP6_018207 [Peronosclerospora sorghi]|uniref:Uncharacterized protein n=1 Tax=Peronosclerospora sorghi TaxID=230839 RepID=A0ACC0WCW2_9STRA|nr:hypothetical protein PsorP6_018207 [Peronosclerospora sorghi]